MTIDQAFVAANTGFILLWLLLIALPHAGITHRLVQSPVLPLAMAACYLAYALPGFILGSPGEGGGFGSLEAVMIAFTSKQAVMAGWIHYLVFDLFIGAWQVRDARRRAITHWKIIPCLILTLMLGPVGLGLYLLLRAVTVRQWSLDEASPGSSRSSKPGPAA